MQRTTIIFLPLWIKEFWWFDRNDHILHVTQDLDHIFSLYDYMDSVLSSKSYRAFVMLARFEQSACTVIIAFCRKYFRAVGPAMIFIDLLTWSTGLF